VVLLELRISRVIGCACSTVDRVVCIYGGLFGSCPKCSIAPVPLVSEQDCT
jgi:hypothetical protein